MSRLPIGLNVYFYVPLQCIESLLFLSIKWKEKYSLLCGFPCQFYRFLSIVPSCRARRRAPACPGPCFFPSRAQRTPRACPAAGSRQRFAGDFVEGERAFVERADFSSKSCRRSSKDVRRGLFRVVASQQKTKRTRYETNHHLWSFTRQPCLLGLY